MTRPPIDLNGYELKEELHRGRGTVVLRGIRMSDGLPVVVKATYGPSSALNDAVRLFHEHSIVSEIKGNGVVRSYGLERENRLTALILEDFGGVSLREYLSSTRLDIPSFLRVALRLCAGIEEVHNAGIVHKDINPSNIIINSATQQVKVTDFGIASRLPAEIARTVVPSVLEGTLPYISPEQTGRMNRAVDYRTDFYSLGITLYEALVGWVPFQSDDMMEILHSHIARPPVPPADLNPSIPRPLSDIIMKLVSKTAEARYQSGRGLRADLEHCLRLWEETGKIAAFPLAAVDASKRLQITQKLYGREEQVSALLQSFERVCTGKTGYFVVSGDAGIGKSSLVHEVHKPIVRQRGAFVAGKFDQFKGDVPYAPFASALRELIDQILASRADELEEWSARLRGALGSNGRVLSVLIPEIELVIGEQPPLQELPPKESQRRFTAVVKSFIRVVATKEHPLVMFLDDLQWADQASLDLIQQLLTDQQLTYFLMIGAHRNDDGTQTHPLRSMLNALHDAGVAVHQVSLQPLDGDAVNRLIAESLGLGADDCRSLAALVAGKTAGNPFFIGEFLKSLFHEGLLRFDDDSRRWDWREDEIRQKGITDNVVAMMADKIRQLPMRTQDCLQYAACLGSTFRFETLVGVRREGSVAVVADLWPAVLEGFLIPLGESYRYLQSASTGGEMPLTDDSLPLSGISFRFSHDRVQQAAYSLIPPGRAAQLHHSIGNSLMGESGWEGRQETLFAAVNHLNLGRERIAGRAERDELVQLNLRAGRKAKASAAFAPALQYFAVGFALTEASDLTGGSSTAGELLKERGECEYLTGDFAGAEETFDSVLRVAVTPLDKGRILGLKIELYIHWSRLDRALEAGITALQLLGEPFRANPGKLAVVREMLKVRWMVGRRRITDLIDLPVMEKEEPRMAMSILMSLFGIAYARSEEFGGLVISRMMTLTLRNGNADVSAYAYSLYGLLVSAGFRAYRDGRELATLGLRLSERFENRLLRGRCAFVFGCLHNHWYRPASTNREFLRDAYRYAMDNGDQLYASYALSQESIVDMFTGVPLPTAYRNAADHLAFVRSIQQDDIALYFETAMHWASGLIGASGVPGGEEHGRFDGNAFLRRLDDATYTPPRMFFRFARVQFLCLTGEYDAAHRLVEDSESMKHALIGQVVEADYEYYSSLVALVRSAGLPRREARRMLAKAAAGERRMRRWAANAPDNFAHKHALIAAERARSRGDALRAMALFDAAIAGARKQGFLHDEGLANQRAGEFHLADGRETIASGYLAEARACFASWGAEALVDALDKRYARLLPDVAAVRAGRAATRGSETTRTGTQTLDLLSILKASQTLSGEIVLSRLLERMMVIVLENAGARRGLLIVEKGSHLVIEAEGIAGADPPVVLGPVPLDQAVNVPVSVVRYVARVREGVLLDDAESAGQFVSDPYVMSAHVKSVLCVPIEHQGKLSGILYLENSLSTGVFTPSRLEVLRLLSSQIAVSMENARLYAQERELARLQEEYRLAAKIQKELLPATAPAVPGYEIFGTNVPAQTVGGDYFDFVHLDDRHLVVCIADVSGKGLPASLLMANLQASLRGQSKLTLSPAECLSHVNRLLFDSTAAEKYATVFYGILDLHAHRFRYSNGGHETPFLLAAGGTCTALSEGGIPLGMLEAFPFEEGEISFSPGDVLVMYSDGITEAMNASQAQFGRERLVDHLREQLGRSVHELATAIVESVRRHEQGSAQSDDITLVAVRRTGVSSPPLT